MMDLRNCDNMEMMAEFPDKHFELAIVDPPYGWGVSLKGRNINGNGGGWNVAPNQTYFSELFRVSQNQIVWGGNYFGLPAHRHFIVWDKKQPVVTFSRCELAWTSFEKNAQIFEYAYFGSHNSDPGRFHPTQKPVALYKWLLTHYASPGDKILDTHLGSMSIAIACLDLGFDLTGCELDPDYYAAGMKRVNDYQLQQKLAI